MMAFNRAAALSGFGAELGGPFLWVRAKAGPPDSSDAVISQSASLVLERAFRKHITGNSALPLHSSDCYPACFQGHEFSCPNRIVPILVPFVLRFFRVRPLACA